MTAPYCGICGDHVAPDMDHTRVDAETLRTADRNDKDDYVLHVGCWRRLTEGWEDPA